MFRPMIRQKKALSKEECQNILKKSTSGVLSLSGDDGYPYGVPLSFVYKDDSVYFHCARNGHKIDSIKKDPKASFCVISKDDVAPEELTTKFESVIAFGTVEIMEDDSERLRALNLLCEKYAPNVDSRGEIEKYFKAVSMLCFKIEHISGKRTI